MDTSTAIMGAAAVLALIAVYSKSPDAAQRGLSAASSLFLEITPRMIAAFILAGLFQVLVPQELIVRWMGQGSGWRGLLIGMSLGGVTPGGPMTHFPVIAALYKMGVGVGPLMAYLTAWSLLGVQRMIMWEIPFLGAKLVALRFAVTLVIPIFVGWLCELIWKKVGV